MTFLAVFVRQHNTGFFCPFGVGIIKMAYYGTLLLSLIENPQNTSNSYFLGLRLELQ